MQNSEPGPSPGAAPPSCGPTRGRGRPRAFDRDAALTQAMHLFWRKGFAATSISDLTAAMGIGSPSLYAAFGSKEGLYTEALRHYLGSVDAGTRGRVLGLRGAVLARLVPELADELPEPLAE